MFVGENSNKGFNISEGVVVTYFILLTIWIEPLLAKTPTKVLVILMTLMIALNHEENYTIVIYATVVLWSIPKQVAGEYP